ncbi:ParA family protein [endosymbiont GvMRE of Glomus versiforme]|uniref:ParA family protein n=1 Tax=endosymbiont GvMRE of Glomus versiforme TaxID=2039283 RepID=UPI000ED42CF5|nr:ParA family protein [endosymbiont GvMRE of Glomus versiforme]RHZ35858.1 ParA-like plasmid partition protein [endosymbiont GvMRE of Glomus versiforme]RHZ36167.1 ParA-like plasmid partition protein [endosymbiont GvMRE of Glomus versiforme]RHZ36216.1 ParA-like plasmid partition protein [endosymbiont GvMRE of Glomus versiforme]
MTIIAFISQKGGVGKSTLSQALATEATKKKLKILLADCDPQQASSYQWSQIKKRVNCQVFQQVKDIWPLSRNYDLIIIDGPARTSQATKEIAEKADLIIQPTGASRLDLVPAVKEFHALKEAGVNKKKLLFILTRLATKAEAEASQQYLKVSGYHYSPLVLYEKASYRQTQNEGKSITETRYKNLQKQAQQLINNLLSYL